MLASIQQFLRTSTRRKTVAIGVAAAAVIALGGGWVFAETGPGHQTTATALLTSAAIASAASAGSQAAHNGTQAGGSRSAAPRTATSNAGTLPVAASLPTGLLPVPAGAIAANSLRSGATTADHSATGGGSTTLFHFGFTAQLHKNGNLSGSVTGNAEIAFISKTIGQLHVSVNCLEVLGNDAYMSGTLTKAGAGLAQGTEILIGVQDDDTAAKPDLISDIFFSPSTPPATCHTFHATPHSAVQGDIEIH